MSGAARASTLILADPLSFIRPLTGVAKREVGGDDTWTEKRYDPSRRLVAGMVRVEVALCRTATCPTKQVGEVGVGVGGEGVQDQMYWRGGGGDVAAGDWSGS